ncbi:MULTISPECIES: hypothetical protein [Xanthomonas]|nr:MULTISPECIES: hypothetical protein [Xanthomonas]MBZ2436345.1 hypothetical protein [Xanthomonas perforans]MBZ2439365.1 hypothetical protein [Xanthomonas perforans]MBZ2444457.1 hypothetical protein [Xanthomonas perforans]MBZ2478783.1 hypothetical protein [Xanthomonas perforans]MBZ2482913.1 hypothetical protein [Xanthomonas perforans]
MTSFDRQAVLRLSETLHSACSEHFSISPHRIREATIRAFGFNSEAAWLAHIDQKPDWIGINFDMLTFVMELAQMTKSWPTAEAVGALASGVRLTLNIAFDPSRQHPRYTNTTYELHAAFSGLDGHVWARPPVVVLPEFFSGKPGDVFRREKFRVDSSWQHRSFPDNELHQEKGQAFGRNILTARLIDNEWQGGLFVYDPEDQKDDRNVRKNAHAALSRAVLASVLPGFRCRVYRPNQYDQRARRVEMFLDPSILAQLHGVDLIFKVPQIGGWRAHVIHPHRYAGLNEVPDEPSGRLHDGFWACDLYFHPGHSGVEQASDFDLKMAFYGVMRERLREMLGNAAHRL